MSSQPLNPYECIAPAWPPTCPNKTVISREQRKSRRFLIQLPLVVRWANENGVGEAEAETQDVSSGGLRFDLVQTLKSGSAVEILMTLPHQLTHAGPVRVRCTGRVVRTSIKGLDKVEVAAAIQRFQFMRDAENAA
jgi:hypothetical protein